jgi:hypothetical protein
MEVGGQKKQQCLDNTSRLMDYRFTLSSQPQCLRERSYQPRIGATAWLSLIRKLGLNSDFATRRDGPGTAFLVHGAKRRASGDECRNCGQVVAVNSPHNGSPPPSVFHIQPVRWHTLTHSNCSHAPHVKSEVHSTTHVPAPFWFIPI